MKESKEEKEARLAAIIKKQVDDSLDERLSGITIPKGYIRCADCGTLIKENAGKCYNCEQIEIEEAIEEGEDELGGDYIDDLLG